MNGTEVVAIQDVTPITLYDLIEDLIDIRKPKNIERSDFGYLPVI